MTIPDHRPYLCYFDLLPWQPLNIPDGLYAYIVYQVSNKKYLALKCFEDYASHHGALDVLARTQYRNKNTSHQHKFFSQALDALFGGELLLLDQELFCWDFQSGGFSGKNPCYQDNYPNWKKTVEQSGLPPNKFIQIDQAKAYKPFLFPYFKSNGQFNAPPIPGIEEKIMALLGGFRFMQTPSSEYIFENQGCITLRSCR